MKEKFTCPFCKKHAEMFYSDQDDLYICTKCNSNANEDTLNFIEWNNARIAELEAERNRLREALKKIASARSLVDDFRGQLFCYCDTVYVAENALGAAGKDEK